ncbi:MAG: DUF4190 domain-containing protein, partial [Actinomycetota bacterium]|nr:DUF4190 domain-containing protein [Actinomycetota bacterium]
MSGNDPEERPQPPQPPPSWETYQQPASPAYPPAPGQHPYGQPAYGFYGQVPHPEANTALIMGIVALAGTFVCGILCVVGPFAWAKGAKVRREIDADPQRWSGRGEATAGYVMGIITT